MTIGIDLSSLQGPHRMRGIGYTLINFLNNLPTEAKSHKFIFFAYPETDTEPDPVSLLNLEGYDYEVRPIRHRRRIRKVLPGKLNLLVSVLNNLIEMRDLYFGDSRIPSVRGIDVFLQTDPNQSIPRKRGMKNVVVIYDLIPYVLEWDYLWSYSYARTRGYSRKAALRCAARRKLYWDKFHINTRRANKLLAISKQTAVDFNKHLDIKSNKIVVTPLGVNFPEQLKVTPHLSKFVKTAWGYIQTPTTLSKNDSYMLYVGGADRRRKVEDLVAAFNHLRASGEDIKLVLAGDSMQGPANIATEEIQYALKTSSYIDEIYFMGFIDDISRDWLYRHALVFVFPSRYEGFGLPVLEAMSYGCPVISYDNAAVREVAGTVPIYAENTQDIIDTVLRLKDSPETASKYGKKGIEHTQKYSWKTASRNIFDQLVS